MFSTWLLSKIHSNFFDNYILFYFMVFITILKRFIPPKECGWSSKKITTKFSIGYGLLKF